MHIAVAAMPNPRKFSRKCILFLVTSVVVTMLLLPAEIFEYHGYLRRILSTDLTNLPAEFNWSLGRVEEVSKNVKNENILTEKEEQIERKSNGIKKVIILAYMRSGSSLTGKLLEQSDNSIYFFEPLRSLEWSYSRRLPLVDFNNNTSIINSKAELARLKESLIRSMFDCNFRATYKETFLDRIDVGCAKCKPFYACLKEEIGLGAVISCLPKVEKECNASQTRIIKTIRLNMQQAGKLLEQDPNLLILHLLRDPRAILKSRIVLGEALGSTRNLMQLWCNDMKQNMVTYESLVDRFKDRLSTLYYEDLARDSIRISQLVYERLNLNFTNDARKWVEDAMLGEDVVGYSYEVKRRNAKRSSRKWRHDIAYELVKEADEACKDFYQRSGFLPVSNETMLRKTDFKLRKKSNVKNTIA